MSINLLTENKKKNGEIWSVREVNFLEGWMNEILLNNIENSQKMNFFFNFFFFKKKDKWSEIVYSIVPTIANTIYKNIETILSEISDCVFFVETFFQSQPNHTVLLNCHFIGTIGYGWILVKV